MKLSNTGRSIVSAAVLVGAFALTGCGQQSISQNSELDIVGGTPVAATQADARFWSTVALTTNYQRSADRPPALDNGKSFCSATIIADRAVLTASHCLQAFDEQTRQKLPDFILPNVSDFLVHFDANVSAQGHYARATHVIPHPNWSPEQTLSPQPASAPDDFGLVIFDTPIPSSKRPIKIGDVNMNLEGSAIYLAGYGVTQNRNNNDTGILRQVDTEVTSVDAASKRIGVGQILRGACAGDSGGPAYVQNGGEWYVVGATSTGAEIAGFCLGLLNNYTDARHYKDWIRTTLAQNGVTMYE